MVKSKLAQISRKVEPACDYVFLKANSIGKYRDERIMASIHDLTDLEKSLSVMKTTPAYEASEMIPLETPMDEQASSSSTESASEARPAKGPSRAQAKKARRIQQKINSSSQPKRPSLRPAKDILSRIRHDPALDDDQFIVGYHDRHADVMEMPVTAWTGGGDFTEEEWIPQHRILYFRRKGENGQKVWDRKERIDLLFGSGFGGGSKGEVKGANTKNGGKEEDIAMLTVKTGSDPEPDGAGAKESNDRHEAGGEARESTDEVDDDSEDIVDRLSYHP